MLSAVLIFHLAMTGLAIITAVIVSIAAIKQMILYNYTIKLTKVTMGTDKFVKKKLLPLSPAVKTLIIQIDSLSRRKL